MRNRFDEQLFELNREIIEMGAMCEEAIASAVKALTTGDIGEGKLRMLIDQNPHEDFYVMNGNRALIKREKFERYLDQATAV